MIKHTEKFRLLIHLVQKTATTAIRHLCTNSPPWTINFRQSLSDFKSPVESNFSIIMQNPQVCLRAIVERLKQRVYYCFLIGWYSLSDFQRFFTHCWWNAFKFLHWETHMGGFIWFRLVINHPETLAITKRQIKEKKRNIYFPQWRHN